MSDLGNPMNAEDRCDVCSAAALVRVRRPLSGPLTFCGHHYNAMAFHLEVAGWYVDEDNREPVPS